MTTQSISFRVSADEKARLQAEAQAEGIPLSAYVRQQTLGYASATASTSVTSLAARVGSLETQIKQAQNVLANFKEESSADLRRTRRFTTRMETS